MIYPNQTTRTMEPIVNIDPSAVEEISKRKELVRELRRAFNEHKDAKEIRFMWNGGAHSVGPRFTIGEISMMLNKK